MKLIYNKIIPFQGFKYINIGGLIFTRSKRLADKFYPIAYLLGWIFAGFKYRQNVFEKEAFENEDNLNYLKTRKFWNWI